MKLVSWNVNGIRAVHNKGLFVPMIEQLQPDILCLQETKALREQSTVDLPAYTEYWNSAEKKGYSGTAIFTKLPPLTVCNGFLPEVSSRFRLWDDFGNLENEGRVITAEFEKFFLVTVYTPNSKGGLERLPTREHHWDPAFLMHVDILQQKKPVVFSGDLNVAHTEDDLANPKSNIGKHGFTDEERSGFDALCEKGFVDTFRLFTKGNGHYSWWSNFGQSRARNVGWRIDYWCVSEALAGAVRKSEIHADVVGSDHCPVSLDITLE
jgi:exodeoxyribonuclease III